MEENNQYYVDYPLGENVMLILYQSSYSKGKIMILERKYAKLANKIQRKLKDCTILKVIQGKLTEEMCKEFEEW